MVVSLLDLGWNAKISNSFLVPQPNNRWSTLDSFTCICVAHPSAKYSWDAHSSYWASPLCSSLCFGTLLCRVQTHKQPQSWSVLNTFGIVYAARLQLDAPRSEHCPRPMARTTVGLHTFPFCQELHSHTDNCLVLKRVVLYILSNFMFVHSG